MDMRASLNNLKRAVTAACWLLAAWSAGAQTVITNVATVNVTPAGFSVVATVLRAAVTSSSTAISVYSDPNGVTNLTGQVGIELFPLNSGDPTATNSYQTLLSENALRQTGMGLGLIYARVSLCAPGTTYYYRVSVITNAAGQAAVWPASGPLPAVSTALQNSFVLQSQQLLITVNDSYPPGSVITLANTNTPFVLAAVVGDGAGKNQVYFSINDLISAAGGTNFSPTGNQTFMASILGQGAAGLSQSYTLAFSTNFSVGQYGAVDLGALETSVSIGTAAMLTGGTGSIPISVNSQSAVTGLSFVLNFPTNLFTAISVQPSIAAVSGASLSLVSANSVRINLATIGGSSLLGSQQVAQLNLQAAAGQPSAFVPVVPQSPAATNADASIVTDFSLQPGQAVVIGAQSLLALQKASGSLSLSLYGIPGDSYQIQSTTNLAGNWSNFMLVPMTNLAQTFPNLAATGPDVFYRAYSFNADPPIIQASLAGTRRSLLTYGIPGTNYTLQSASSPSGSTSWSAVFSYTMTNSFQVITNLDNSAPIFYRLKR
jgi:hypothetical protein